MAMYLQGAFRMPADATVRVTYDPTGTPSTSDWALTAGDYWSSLDDLITEWNAQLESDLGAGKVVVSTVPDTEAHRAKVRLTTDGVRVSVAWSHAGTGDKLRAWLGATADLTDSVSPATLPNNHLAGWYPDEDQGGGAMVGTRRTLRQRHRMRTPLLSGAVQTQHNTSPTDVDPGAFDLLLRCHDGNSQQDGLSALGTFIDQIHDLDAGAWPVFTLVYDAPDSPVTLRLVDDDLAVDARMVDGALPTSLWEMSMTCEVAA